jgi:hypothetical protein
MKETAMGNQTQKRTVVSRSWMSLMLVLVVLLSTVALSATERAEPASAIQVKGKRRSGMVLEQVRLKAAPVAPLGAPAQPANGFSPIVRLGFTTGDQWEPAIAADRLDHIYVLYPQYLGVPGCPDCPSPTMILLVSGDRGSTWSAPRQIAPPGTGQWDAQIVVDPVDGRTVYASWLQNGKSDIAVAKSTDFGVTWNVTIADSTNAGTDKPILVVRGPHVYVGYNHAQKVWVSASHDGGATFTSVPVNPNGKLGWSLAGGGAIDSAGNAYFAWSGYEQNGGAKGPVNLYVSKSSDGGNTWSLKIIDVSGAPFPCAEYFCGWAYLGAQITLAIDANDTLYAAWNSAEQDKAPHRIYFATSTDAGKKWSKRKDLSTAPAGVNHTFPTLTAGAGRDVRVSWMDSRVADGTLWNTWYRSSTDGGKSWAAETDISGFVTGYDYIQPDGFAFPFGDYYELTIDDRGTTQAIFGIGRNYDSPGSIWYTRGK